MKKLFIFAIFAIILASSCAPTLYYQVGEIKSNDKNVQLDNNNNLIYTDNNISITYSFWGSYGEVYFIISNNSEHNITIHLDNSYFIRNGIAYDYFQNRTYTTTNTQASSVNTSGSKTLGASLSSLNHYYISYPYTYTGTGYAFTSNSSSQGFSSSRSNSTTYKEVPKLIIPAKTSKIINQFNVADYMYRSCDLYLWQNTLSSTKENKSTLLYMGTPKGEEMQKAMLNDKGKILNKVIFNTENSPYKFENRITYSIADSEEKIEVTNKFYVENIQNCSENKFKTHEYQKNCDDEMEEQVLVNLLYAPNKYYIKYSTSDFNSTVKH